MGTWHHGGAAGNPVSSIEFIIGKLVPNFALGMCAMGVCVLAALFVFGHSLRGSIFSLFGFTAHFLSVALSLGLLISTVARTQFLASQIAMMVAYLPGSISRAFCSRLPACRAAAAFAAIVPAKYYVQGLQTIFLAGDIGAVPLPASAVLAGMAVLLLALTARNSRKRLD
jgi:ABC-2 type transport system permease protein